MNSGIRDATNLAWKLAAVDARRGRPGARRHLRRRAPARTRPRWSGSRRGIGAMYRPRNIVTERLRDVVFRGVQLVPGRSRLHPADEVQADAAVHRRRGRRRRPVETGPIRSGACSRSPTSTRPAARGLASTTPSGRGSPCSAWTANRTSSTPRRWPGCGRSAPACSSSGPRDTEPGPCELVDVDGAIARWPARPHTGSAEVVILRPTGTSPPPAGAASWARVDELRLRFGRVGQ